MESNINPSSSELSINQPLMEATKVMFDRISDYLKGELQLTIEDFQLLEKMNKITLEKYSEMNTKTENLSKLMQDIQNKYKEFEPYLKKIEQIDTNVNELENTVKLLDDYTKQLEEKFKKFLSQKKEKKKD